LTDSFEWIESGKFSPKLGDFNRHRKQLPYRDYDSGAGMTEESRWIIVMPDLISAENGIFDRHPERDWIQTAVLSRT